MKGLKHQLSNLGGSFWFVPSLIVLVSIGLAVSLVELETAESREWMEDWPRVFGAGADGARAILATIAGSMVTVVGVTFSMTLTTLALASNQYTSRILRNFMGDRATQVVLGVFAGIFTYCIIVLRTVRGSDEGDFIPSLAVAGSLVLAIGGVGALIFFIHHVAASIQASSIIASVADETFASVDRLFPGLLGSGGGTEKKHVPLPLPPHTEWHSIDAMKDGYIQHVDDDALLRLACKHDAVARMERGIGDFVLRDAPLVSLALPKPPDDGVKRALRALSPSTNDPTTAGMCVDYLTAILARLAIREIPSDYRYKDGRLRLIATGPTFRELATLAFDEIQGNAAGNAALLVKLVVALETIGARTHDAERRRVVRELLDRVAEAGRRTLKTRADTKRFEERLGQALTALA